MSTRSLALPEKTTTASKLDENNSGIWACGIILFFCATRLWIAGSGQIDLAQDEAQYWDWSRHLQLSYYSKGPLIAWLIYVTTSVFGNTELGVRIGAIFLNMGTQFLLYIWLARIVCKPRLAIATLLITNTAPLFIVSGILMTTDNPLLFCWVAGLLCLSAITRFPTRQWPYWGIGCATALGLLAKYTMLAFAGSALLYVLVLLYFKILPVKSVQRLLLALATGLIVGLLPIIIWNINHDFVSFRHVAKLAGVSASANRFFRLDIFPEYLLSQMGLVLPWWLFLMLWQGRNDIRQFFSCCRKKEPVQCQSIQKNKDTFCLSLLLNLSFWPLCSFFILWSFHTRIYPNWPAMSYAAGFVLAAQGLLNFSSTRPKSIFISTIGILSLVVCVLLHGQHVVTSILHLPDNINPTVRLKGWNKLGQALTEIQKNMPDSDKVFFFSNAYDVTAELAFYAPGQPTAYCADFGRRMSQYDLWPSPNGTPALINLHWPDNFQPNETGSRIVLSNSTSKQAVFTWENSEKIGWSAVFVARKELHAIPLQLYTMFDHVGEIQSISTTHKGQKGRTFGYVILHGYRGYWPLATQQNF